MDGKHISWNDIISKRFNHLLLPKSIRGLIIGNSGSGKTTLLLNLLLCPSWLDYNNLSVFAKKPFSVIISYSQESVQREVTKGSYNATF